LHRKFLLEDTVLISSQDNLPAPLVLEDGKCDRGLFGRGGNLGWNQFYLHTCQVVLGRSVHLAAWKITIGGMEK
jgi:hypothetical protein